MAPDLSIVAFRLAGHPGADDATVDRLNQDLLARVNASGRVHISSTRVGGRVVLRFCFIVHRTHHDRAAEAVEIVREAARQVRAAGETV